MVTVKLKIKYTKAQDIERDVYTLNARVVEYINITRHIFVFAKDLEGVSTFQTTATPVRIEEIPDTTPDHPGSFYRTNEVTLEFSKLGDRERVYRDLEARINQLVQDWHALYPNVVSEEEIEYTATD